MSKQGYVYLMSNVSGSVLYVGVTSNLLKRVFEHKYKLGEGFTKRYNVTQLVYFEVFDDMYHAIEREKKIKGGSRQSKLSLIRKDNPDFKDLYPALV